MEKMQAIGEPFPVQYSSCSDKKPKYFEWTNEHCPIKVFMDQAIAPGMNYTKKPGDTKKVAWICESRAIFHSWAFPRDLWEKHLDKIVDSYDEIYVSDKHWCQFSPKIKFCFAGSNSPWVKEPKIYEKTKLTSMIASAKVITHGHQIRHSIANKFKDKIDVYGGAAGSKRFGGGTWPDKSEAMNDYMFSIVIENDSYSTYFTEKITDCFATGTIPIYWGAPEIGDYFNMDGIILYTPDFDISILTPELYKSKMSAVLDNLERVKSMDMADDFLYKLITNEN
jgi:hypothetical protein